MKTNLKNWARNCHFDYLIAIKEQKGKRWMSVLSAIEAKGNFNIDDFENTDKSWTKILETINKMNDGEILKLDIKRNSL